MQPQPGADRASRAPQPPPLTRLPRSHQPSADTGAVSQQPPNQTPRPPAIATIRNLVPPAGRLQAALAQADYISQSASRRRPSCSVPALERGAYRDMESRHNQPRRRAQLHLFRRGLGRFREWRRRRPWGYLLCQDTPAASRYGGRGRRVPASLLPSGARAGRAGPDPRPLSPGRFRFRLPGPNCAALGS